MSPRFLCRRALHAEPPRGHTQPIYEDGRVAACAVIHSPGVPLGKGEDQQHELLERQACLWNGAAKELERGHQPLAASETWKRRTCARQRFFGEDLQDATKARHSGRFAAHSRGRQKRRESAWRRSAMALRLASGLFVYLSAGKIAYAIARQLRPGADRLCPGFVCEHPSRELNAAQILGVALVGNTHVRLGWIGCAPISACCADAFDGARRAEAAFPQKGRCRRLKEPSALPSFASARADAYRRQHGTAAACPCDVCAHRRQAVHSPGSAGSRQMLQTNPELFEPNDRYVPACEASQAVPVRCGSDRGLLSRETRAPDRWEGETLCGGVAELWDAEGATESPKSPAPDPPGAPAPQATARNHISEAREASPEHPRSSDPNTRWSMRERRRPSPEPACGYGSARTGVRRDQLSQLRVQSLPASTPCERVRARTALRPLLHVRQGQRNGHATGALSDPTWYGLASSRPRFPVMLAHRPPPSARDRPFLEPIDPHAHAHPALPFPTGFLTSLHLRIEPSEQTTGELPQAILEGTHRTDGQGRNLGEL